MQQVAMVTLYHKLLDKLIATVDNLKVETSIQILSTVSERQLCVGDIHLDPELATPRSTERVDQLHDALLAGHGDVPVGGKILELIEEFQSHLQQGRLTHFL